MPSGVFKANKGTFCGKLCQDLVPDADNSSQDSKKAHDDAEALLEIQLQKVSKALTFLGLAKSATLPAVRRAWQRKARLLHPDVNASPYAQEEFIEAWEAYEVVVDFLAMRSETKSKTRQAPRQPPAPYYCRDCGDGFSELGDCFRCDVPVISRSLEAMPSERPEVDAFIERIENRVPSRFSKLQERHWLAYFTVTLYFLGILHFRMGNVPAAVLVLLFAFLGTYGTWSCWGRPGLQRVTFSDHSEKGDTKSDG